MYLSRVALDVGKRETMRLLSSPEYIHGAVERCFEGGKERRLWRIDTLRETSYLLIVSAAQPDFTSLAAQYAPAANGQAWQIKPYTPFLNRLKAGQRWHFRLRANPVRSVKDGEAPRGKVMAHVTTEQQKNWLLTRARDFGFSLEPEQFDVVHTQWHRFDKGRGRQVTLRTASYEGSLTIQDADHLREALMDGIGRAKAFGCGLMTLAPLPGQPHA